jgi:hypothetical protein
MARIEKKIDMTQSRPNLLDGKNLRCVMLDNLDMLVGTGEQIQGLGLTKVASYTMRDDILYDKPNL